MLIEKTVPRLASPPNPVVPNKVEPLSVRPASGSLPSLAPPANSCSRVTCPYASTGNVRQRAANRLARRVIVSLLFSSAILRISLLRSSQRKLTFNEPNVIADYRTLPVSTVSRLPTMQPKKNTFDLFLKRPPRWKQRKNLVVFSWAILAADNLVRSHILLERIALFSERNTFSEVLRIISPYRRPSCGGLTAMPDCLFPLFGALYQKPQISLALTTDK